MKKHDIEWGREITFHLQVVPGATGAGTTRKDRHRASAKRSRSTLIPAIMFAAQQADTMHAACGTNTAGGTNCLVDIHQTSDISTVPLRGPGLYFYSWCSDVQQSRLVHSMTYCRCICFTHYNADQVYTKKYKIFLYCAKKPASPHQVELL